MLSVLTASHSRNEIEAEILIGIGIEIEIYLNNIYMKLINSVEFEKLMNILCTLRICSITN